MDKYSIRKLTEMSLTEQKSKLVDIVWSLAKISRGQNEEKALELGINSMKGELDDIKTAINAGVDSVEHSSFIDEETIMLAIENDVFLSMDIYVSDYILGEGALNGILEESLEKERKTGRLQRENFRKAVNLGAKITFGTDAGIFEHGNNAKQFKYMVKWGMTSLQAIQASTIVAADLLGINNIAHIKEDHYADIIGVEDNPIVNIEALENVTFVMKDGSIIINQP